MEALHGLNTIF